jgi:protein TonB
MRKVYHHEKSPVGFVMALLIGVGLMGVLFGILPFTHIIGKPSGSVELRKAAVVDAPPQKDQEVAPPPQEDEKPPDAPPPPKLADVAQAIPLSADLEVVSGAAGGTLAGFGDMRKMTAVETTREEAFSVEDLDKRPEPVSQVPPAYPPELRKLKIEGKVTLLCFVSADGRVEEVRVGNSSRPEFEKPAMEAMRKWRFRPGMKQGQAVGAYVSYPISFRIAGR